MQMLGEYVLRGLLSGAVYGLLALPMSLVFSTVRTVDLAVGGYALIAAAVATSTPGWPGLSAGVAAAILAAGATAALCAALKRTGREDHITFALVSFGVLTAIGSLVLWRFGSQAFVRSAFQEPLVLVGIRVMPQGLINLGVTCLVVTVVYIILYATNLGRMMRATAASPVAAALAGIHVGTVQYGAYVAGGLLSGLAGILILYTAGLDFSAPLQLTLSGFGAAILFGLDSPLRCLLGGFAMGIAEALAAGYTSGAITSAVPFAFVLLVLTTSNFGNASRSAERP